ncbi:30S ribosomal protein S2 [bacterium]|nr:30S ribosomal protein S2 [bacterium]
MVDFSQLIKAGLHFGHQTSRWCPKMAPYIWGQRGGVHLLDISKIAYSLEKAAVFLESVAAEGKTVLWVGTKKPAKELIVNTAKALNMPYVDHRWVGGTITNFYQVKKAVTKYLHYQDVIAKAAVTENHHYTKKELGGFQKSSDRMEKTVGGLKELRMPLGALVVIDVRKEITAIQEATAAGIPVVALVDTNGDPEGVSFVIPGNDDSPNGIQLVLEYLAARVAKGAEFAKANSITPVVVDEEIVEGATADIEKDTKAAAKKVKVAAKGGKSTPVKRGKVSPKAKAVEATVDEDDDSEDEA